MNDTSPAMEKLYRQLIMSRTPEERFKMTCGMFDTARKLAIAGIKHQNPGINEKQVRALLFMRFYGQDFSKEKCREILGCLNNVQIDILERQGLL